MKLRELLDPLGLERQSRDWWLEDETAYKVLHTADIYVASKMIVFVWAILCFVTCSTAIQMDERKCFCVHFILILRLLFIALRHKFYVCSLFRPRCCVATDIAVSSS